MNTIALFFSAPVFDDPQKTHAAWVLHILLLVIFGVIAIARPLAVRANRGTATASSNGPLVAIVGLSVIAVLWILNKLGFVQLTGILLTALMILLMTMLLPRTGGIKSPNMAGFLIAISIAWVTLGWPWDLGAICLSLVCILGVWKFAPPSLTPVVSWVNYAAFGLVEILVLVLGLWR